MRRLILSAAVLAMSSGCIAVGSMQTADTLGQGNFQFAVEPGVWGVAAIANDVEGAVLPHVDFAARYGLTDTVDIGARFGSSLLEIQSKFLLTDPNDPGKAISLAPSIAGIFVGAGEGVGGYANVALPLLIGLKTGGGSEFVLGPRINNTIVFAGGDGNTGIGNSLSVGASVGYAARVGEGFRVMPEISMLVPLVQSISVNGESDAAAGFAGGLIQFKVGLLFGGGRRAPSALATGE
ncbi:hypothetical protein P2318_29465 [Myxococcaceae bacterium GXIMD 01537]